MHTKATPRNAISKEAERKVDIFHARVLKNPEMLLSVREQVLIVKFEKHGFLKGADLK